MNWIELATSLGVGLGLAAAAGLRVFLPMLVLGCAARIGWVPLATGFEWLASGPGLSALGVATILEISAYYIPWIDNALDAVAGPMAVLAGVLATAAVTFDLPPIVRWSVAIIAGGGTAGTVQALTTVARLKSTAFTGGAGNPFLATFELIGSLATAIAAVLLPVVAICLVVAMFVVLRRKKATRVA